METMGAPNVSGTVKFDSVAIIATDGRKVPISELGPAEEMREKIMGWRVVKGAVSAPFVES